MRLSCISIFVKVAFCGPLPKGAVAYVVVSFISATFILKSYQPFWREDIMIIYRYSVGLYFGVGHVLESNFHRINQYGYTEARVYLVVVGAIPDGDCLLFFFRRTALFVCGCA